MEESSIDLGLDEAAEARIAHADYLNAMKDWGIELGQLVQPFGSIAEILMDEDRSEEDLVIASRMFPLGYAIVVQHINKMYEMMQREAVKVLGAPFQLHEQHHPLCEENNGHCGHQDHYLPKDSD
jgi:hypothetical protein